MNSGICAGVNLYAECVYNSECYFGMYCNEQGRCVLEKSAGAICSQNVECGRYGLCIFETVLSTYGICITMLSASDGTQVYPLYLTDMANTAASTYSI
jgi:hypothetical protein